MKNAYLSLSSGEKEIIKRFPVREDYDRALREILTFRKEAEANSAGTNSGEGSAAAAEGSLRGVPPAAGGKDKTESVLEGKDGGRGDDPEPAPAPAMTPLPYRFAVLPAVTVTLQEYRAPGFQEQIRERLLDVLREEAPILKDTLFRRVLASFGIAKSSASLDATEKAFRAAGIRVTKQKGYYYCWMPGQNPDKYDKIRVGGDRRADELCQQEIRNAVIYALGQRGRLDRAALIKETSLVLGYRRLGRNLETVITDAVQAASADGSIRREGDYYTCTYFR